MSEEKIKVEFTRYKDHEEKPTCAVDFSNNKFCFFHATKRYGTTDFCLFVNEKIKRGDNGFLRPHKNCSLWID